MLVPAPPRSVPRLLTPFCACVQARLRLQYCTADASGQRVFYHAVAYRVAGDRRVLEDGDGDSRSVANVHANDLGGKKVAQRALCKFLRDPAHPEDLQSVQPLQIYKVELNTLF